MPELLAVEDGEQETDAKWSQKIIEAMEKASSLGRRRRVFFCDYNNLVVLGCERRVCEGSKRAELGRCWRRPTPARTFTGVRLTKRPLAICSLFSLFEDKY